MTPAASTERTSFTKLAISSTDEFLYGLAPKPVSCGNGLTVGGGVVVPEINFTLPPMDINPQTWPQVVEEYRQMITGICERAAALDVPALLVEFETLPPMTVHPEWGIEITRLLSDTLKQFYDTHGLKSALRLTPNDTREHQRPPMLKSGKYWDGMVEFFNGAAEAGADMISIESTGGKEISDPALMNADIRQAVFALGVLASRDMDFLWTEIVRACNAGGMVAAGDSACGFANTALALAEQRMIPRVFAAVMRVAAAPRSLVALEAGAVGPSKDCAYEGPYLKAIAGIPISMEGRTAACAHLSSMGNIAQALCDCWSNESVQNIKLLSAHAPVVSMEQLAYDCRLLNIASQKGQTALVRDLLVESDAALDPQAWVLRPDVVLRLSEQIVKESDSYSRTLTAVRATIAELKSAIDSGQLAIPKNEVKWLDRLEKQAETIPDSEGELIDQMMMELDQGLFVAAEYGL